ncbi:MAG: glutamate 5-kinase [Peptococcaceae bacterium]|jgi:glutamate 5-kinase|nr:glutamate 5-kinase [Peptococcaceae bacterium]
MRKMAIVGEWEKLTEAKRIVVKVGTSTLTDDTGSPHLGRMANLVRQMANLRQQGREIIFVTSGAVGAGMGRLGIREKPREISARQALAAIGQGLLMQTYERLFGEYGLAAAQVLLTRDDVAHRQRYLNARTTLRQILCYGAVPIINENDTVTFDEIQLGDNDTLAALTAGLTDADLLVLLSDIDGLYTQDPRKDPAAGLIPLVGEITPAIEALAGDPGGRFGSGGMRTKIAAARIAVSQGIPMVLANGSHPDCLGFLAAASASLPRGTLFLPTAHPLGSRKGWLAFSARGAGKLTVDDGAAAALLEKGKSLLPSGIAGTAGGFERGDVLEIESRGQIIARGITNYSERELLLSIGRHSGEIEGILGPGRENEVIHRDNLCLMRGNI